MLALAPSQLNRIDFKGPSIASEGNYITNKLILLKMPPIASEEYII